MDGTIRRPEDREDKRICRFSDDIDKTEITGYSEVYGIHPRAFEIFADYRGRLHRRKVNHSQDPFTGQLKAQVRDDEEEVSKSE